MTQNLARLNLDGKVLLEVTLTPRFLVSDRYMTAVPNNQDMPPGKAKKISGGRF